MAKAQMDTLIFEQVPCHFQVRISGQKSAFRGPSGPRPISPDPIICDGGREPVSTPLGHWNYLYGSAL
jgi:hypothetical protein